MAGLNASRWALPSDDNTMALNPAMPPFQPNGSEMERYQAPRTTTGMTEMQNYIVGMNLMHTSDMSRIHRLTDQNTRDIEDIRAAFQSDLKILEQKIQDFEMIRSRDDSPGAQYTTAKDIDYALSDDMVNGYNVADLAKAYLHEADEREEMAFRLRQQAAALSGEVAASAQVEVLGTAPASSTAVTAGSEFACCANAYDSIHELLQHVKEAHSSSPPSIEPPQPSVTEPRSHAIQIKDPQDTPADANLVKAEASNANTTAISDRIPAAKWTPSIVRQMAPVNFDIPDHKETFTFELIQDILRGSLWSSGFYFVSGNTVLPSKTYWILESDCEPFIPTSPGKHGAKLTAVFNESPTSDGPELGNYMNVPVFIKESGKNTYRYYGNYSQTRYSDKVGYDVLVDHVPDHTLRQWADRLSEIGRPQWVTEALTRHFWPQPEYQGPFPTDSALNTPATVATGGNSASGGTERRVTRALHDYAQELKDWQKEAALHTSLLTSDAIYKAFKKPDSDTEPGLRLWWEYLECVKYDTKFYDILVRLKHDPRNTRRNVSRPAPGANQQETTPAPDVGGKTVDGDEVETVTALDLDEEPVVLDPVHPPPPNPKKLQNEQWGQVDVAGAEEQSKKPTTFKRINFEDGKQQMKAIEAQLRKAGVATKKPSMAVKGDKSHCNSVKPWQTGKERDVKSANTWQGGGDIELAKKLNEGFRDGRVKKGEASSGGGSRKKGLPPHAR